MIDMLHAEDITCTINGNVIQPLKYNKTEIKNREAEIFNVVIVSIVLKLDIWTIGTFVNTINGIKKAK